MSNPAVKPESYAALRSQLPAQLPSFLLRQRWFGGKARQIVSTEIADIMVASSRPIESLLVLVTVKFADAVEENYVLPLVAVSPGEGLNDSRSAILRITGAETGQTVFLGNALENDGFHENLLQVISDEKILKGESSELRGDRCEAFDQLCPRPGESLKAKLLKGEQSNSSVLYGDRLILKFFRRIEKGVNPDLEITSFLTQRARYRHVPPLAGYLEYRTREGKGSTQAILQAFVPNEGDAWKYTLKSLEGFYEARKKVSGRGSDLSSGQIQQFTRETIGEYLKSIALLGRRTAELHLALASDSDDPAFASEPFSIEFRQSFEAALMRMTSDVLRLLREKLSLLPVQWQPKAQGVAHNAAKITAHFREILSKPFNCGRIRIHGDYHLGQVLYTGSDFVIIDFEGEPARPLNERRIKRSPLQDVAGMLRSFHYSAFAPLLGTSGGDSIDARRFEQLHPWAESWNAEVAETFLAEYFRTCGAAPFLPRNPAETRKLLELHLLEKAIYELGYELNNRPDWVGLPLEGIAKLLEI
jgi:maltose alpha-D-glucosyltransferase/alpha-amylase